MFRRRLRGPRLLAGIRGRGQGPETRARSLLSLVAILLAAAVVTPIPLAASRAPLLTVRAETLKWTVAGKHHLYRVLIRAPGKVVISTVAGRTLTPRAVP